VQLIKIVSDASRSSTLLLVVSTPSRASGKDRTTNVKRCTSCLKSRTGHLQRCTDRQKRDACYLKKPSDQLQSRTNNLK
jgi:hypothetical protein